MRILTAAQMRRAEADAVARGASYEALMENAGAAAARTLQQFAQERHATTTALFLCGRGNNAGDAFVAARLLAQEGWQCRVLALCGIAYSPLTQMNVGRLPANVFMMARASGNWNDAFIVDGVFGTGFKGQLPVRVASAFRRANESPGMRVALDIPSGVPADGGLAAQESFRADYTLTFGAYKPGLLEACNAPYCGTVRCLNIGL